MQRLRVICSCLNSEKGEGDRRGGKRTRSRLIRRGYAKLRSLARHFSLASRYTVIAKPEISRWWFFHYAKSQTEGITFHVAVSRPSRSRKTRKRDGARIEEDRSRTSFREICCQIKIIPILISRVNWRWRAGELSRPTGKLNPRELSPTCARASQSRARPRRNVPTTIPSPVGRFSAGSRSPFLEREVQFLRELAPAIQFHRN